MDNSSQMGGGNTGTRDVTYDLTSVLYHALQGVENCQTYAGDTGGKQVHRQFFQMALDNQRRIAEQAKQLLHDCLMQETGGQQGMSQSSGMSQGGSMGQSHSFSEARDDGSAFRFASSETEGGSDQFSGGQSGSDMDRQGGSALRSGEHTGAVQNDPGSGQFGQDPLGQGQRHNEMTTGGGGTSNF